MAHSKIFVLFLFIISAVFVVPGDHNKEDKAICMKKFALAVDKNLQSLPVNDAAVEIGKSFLGLEYAAFTLEKEGDESLVINLRGLDCTTFLENCVVFARCIKKGKTTFEDYAAELQYIRYRSGVMNLYPSRLHYFSDWIYDNAGKGIVKDITKELKGVPYNKKVSFMTENSHLYAKLKNNKKFLDSVLVHEKKINGRQYYYIPKKDVKKVEESIANGDLIAITSSVNGLDINHVGLAVRIDGVLRFMHAPLVGSKVQITEGSLSEYLASIKKHTGIMVARLLEP